MGVGFLTCFQVFHEDEMTHQDSAHILKQALNKYAHAWTTSSVPRRREKDHLHSQLGKMDFWAANTNKTGKERGATPQRKAL